MAIETGLYLTINHDRLTYLIYKRKLLMSSTRLPYPHSLNTLPSVPEKYSTAIFNTLVPVQILRIKNMQRNETLWQF